MAKFLDIIIPQYKEDEGVLKNLLDSIARQKNIDFTEIGIRIQGDCGYRLSDEFLKSYSNLDIIYNMNEKNSGTGRTEQAAVDASTAEFLTFIDADDEFYSDISLREIIHGLKNSPQINILCTAMVQENMKNGQLVRSAVNFNMLRTLHGVFVRRSYLLEHDIRFNERLHYFEDTYYVSILTCRNDMVVIANLTYVWKWNDQSKTLQNNKYDVSVRRYEEMLHAYIDVYDYFVKHNIPKKEFYLIQQTMELVCILESSYFDYPELLEQKEKYEDEVYNLYKTHKDIFDSLNPSQKLAYTNYVMRDVMNYYKGIRILLTFDQFIAKMMNKEKNQD